MGRWDDIKFNRWEPLSPHTIPYRIYKSYDCDLMGMITSFESAKGYIYHHLKEDGALWDSKAFDFGLMKKNKSRTIKEWSRNYEEFGNWVRLSLLVSLCSYLEIYMACIIKESIESDPGILIGTPHAIDGIALKKRGSHIKKDEIDLRVKNCTKGTWQSRLEHMFQLYGKLPESLSNSISELEAIRKIRNDYGHAFGRDIIESHDYFKTNKSPIRRLSIKRFNKFRTLINRIVQDFDVFINKKHIGNYEQILQYHEIYNTISILNRGEQTIRLKASLQVAKNSVCNKDFCRGIIVYYNTL